MLRIAGLWRQCDKEGREFWSGPLNSQVRVLVFRNSFKQKESDPDFTLCLAPEQKKANNSARQTQTQPEQRETAPTEDEIPF